METLYRQYQRKGLSEMIPLNDFLQNESIGFVSVSEQDKQLPSDEFELGYVARNPKNHADKWYVAKKYFDDNLELFQPVEPEEEPKHPTSWRDFTMTDKIEPQEPKCEECPSKQFYEANTAKIMDKIEQPEISVTDEEIRIYTNIKYPLDRSDMRYVENQKDKRIIFIKGAKAMRDGKIQSKRVK